METPLLIPINKKQTYTQSPAAYVRYFDFDKGRFAPTLSRPSYDDPQIQIPSICIVYHDESSQMAKWEIKLSKMKNLRSGWNGYSAPVPSEIAILTARGFISSLIRGRQEPKRVTPSAVGGVGVTQRNANKKVFVEFFNDGKVFVLFSDGRSEPVSKEVLPSLKSFKDLTTEMQEYLNA